MGCRNEPLVSTLSHTDHPHLAVLIPAVNNFQAKIIGDLCVSSPCFGVVRGCMYVCWLCAPCRPDLLLRNLTLSTGIRCCLPRGGGRCWLTRSMVNWPPWPDRVRLARRQFFNSTASFIQVAFFVAEHRLGKIIVHGFMQHDTTI